MDHFIDDSPAQQMSLADWERHLASTVIIEIEEPFLNLRQGNWLRCSRRNVNATLNTILKCTPGNVRLKVNDSITAAELRRRALAQRG